MIVLPTTNVSLEIDLGGAAAATESQFSVCYENVDTAGNSTPSLSHGTTSGTTAVTMVSAPTAGQKRLIKSIHIHNADSGNTTVTIQLNDNSTTRKLAVFTLATLENLVYESGTGWTAYTSVGGIK
jgi:hypothetical protein